MYNPGTASGDCHVISGTVISSFACEIYPRSVMVMVSDYSTEG